ncbi:CaiB/BaiF CoA transferase family protein [Nitratireductor pacificus]|uniref:L-carnitine dehydratase/bile acid-inducible protein F n=1 Tax=Nitratireductor pacificus pht-3B TaxID=391937 RepID=K2MJT4_9HYPH|nr:CaiB/BaiF CoA-transferase family protein [Nitratireductor pacificus]EKF17452.1 L-carnitine dehydratase/bile acid-inducible protein F [Nitratireductor pacificus pht-3B]
MGGPRKGPLSGLAVIEMAGLGPVPLAGLMLAEMGADVLRIERRDAARAFLKVPPQYDLDRHGREILKLDLKRDEGRALLMTLIGGADVLIEGFRPGVMERLGAGPEAALACNPRLVYGRMTGFGQEGPLADRAGHDLTYLAYSGVLSMIGRRNARPVPPLNLVGDYGGGTMFLIAGVLAALIERAQSGKGQVVDTAMVDGASMLAAPFFGFAATGFWRAARGENLLDGDAPFYDTYEAADGGHLAVACLEPQFFAEFARLLPLDKALAAAQYDEACWPRMRAAIAARIAEKPRDAWAALFSGTDACVAPVLTLKEAAEHPHNRARNAHATQGGFTRPAPAPRFSRTQGEIAQPARPASALNRFGIAPEEVERLAAEGVIGDGDASTD